MKKAVIYARYSSAGQTEQSIEGQLRVCNDYAKSNDFIILDTYIDRARTAQNDNRPQFQQMLQDSKEKKWNYVIVYAVDRFARDDSDYGADKKLLKTNGVKLLSATEIIGTNADGSENLSGILTEGLLVSLAKYYSRELSKKVKRGQFESFEKRNFLGSSILYGYYVDKELESNKKLIIDENQANIVKKIFTMYANGSTADDISNTLRAEGIKNKSGRFFCKNTIMNMLKNKKYTGVFKYGEYGEVEGYHPAIIDKKLFNICAEKITRRKRSVEKFKDYGDYILSGKLYCGDCKSLMYGESGTSKTGKIYYYYKCFNKKKNLGCKKENIAKDYLENLVFQIALGNLFSEDTLLELLDNVVLAHNVKIKNDKELNIWQHQLSENQKYIDNLLSAIKNGIFSETTQAELVKLEGEKKNLQELIIKKQSEQEKELSREQVLHWIKTFAFESEVSKQKKAQIINILVEAIILWDKKIVIVFRNGSDNKKTLSIDDLIDNLGSSKKNYLAEEVVFVSNTSDQVYFTKHYIIVEKELE